MDGKFFEWLIVLLNNWLVELLSEWLIDWLSGDSDWCKWVGSGWVIG